MAFGGSLNKNGTKYYRIIREADRTAKYLEDLKQYLTPDEREQVSKTIDIIVNHVDKLSEGKIEDL